MYKDYFYYGCKHRSMTRGHKCTYRNQINEELLDKSVAEVVSRLVSRPKFAELMQEKINTQVETVVLLSQQKPDDHIEIEINLDEIDATSAETKASYKEIEEWVQEHYGFHVTNLNISQVKRKNGIIESKNYNKPKSDDSKQPGTTPEKEKAITEALKYYKMI